MPNSMMGGSMNPFMNNPAVNYNESEENKIMSTSDVQMVDGVQVVTINAKEFRFIPSEIHIKVGLTKFVMTNSGVAEHEMVVYETSKKDMIDKAELAEDKKTYFLR